MNKQEFCGPLLITGSSRSGTTFLYRVANSLPGIKVAYEANIIKEAVDRFKRHDVLASRALFADYLEKLRFSGTRSGRNESFEQKPEFYDSLFDSFREHRDIKRFICELYVAGRQCKIWGDKCEIAQIRIIKELFPDTRIIWIVRDPRSVVCSFSEHSAGNYYTTSLAWASASRQARELSDALGPSSVLILRYEELVGTPMKVIDEIAAFVGVSGPIDTSMINKAHTGSIEKWRNLLFPGETKRIEEICYDEMLYYGYEPMFAKSRKSLNPLQFILYIFQHTIGLLKKRPERIRRVLSFGTLLKWIRIYVDGWR